MSTWEILYSEGVGRMQNENNNLFINKRPEDETQPYNNKDFDLIREYARQLNGETDNDGDNLSSEASGGI